MKIDFTDAFVFLGMSEFWVCVPDTPWVSFKCSLQHPAKVMALHQKGLRERVPLQVKLTIVTLCLWVRSRYLTIFFIINYIKSRVSFFFLVECLTEILYFFLRGAILLWRPFQIFLGSWMIVFLQTMWWDHLHVLSFCLFDITIWTQITYMTAWRSWATNMTYECYLCR